MIIKKTLSFIMVSIAAILFVSPVGAQKPNLQEIITFKQRRDMMLAQYKSTIRDRDEAYKRMKVAERDYKNAVAQLNKAQVQETEVESKIEQLKQSSGQMDKAQYAAQMQRLKSSQNANFASIKTFQQIQDKSLQDLRAMETQYKSLEVNGQQIRQRMDAAQRQLQFILSQP
jgi:chromosome segregation ATPase